MASIEVRTEPKSRARVELRHILDTPREPAFDRLTRLMAQALHAPVALITFIDGQRQWFKSTYGLADPWNTRRETPLSHSFCQHVVRLKRPLIVPDARRDPLVQENRAIPEIGVEAYAGVPLAEVDGPVLGSLAVVDKKPRQWTDEEVALLEDFAALTMIELQLRVETNERRQAEESLSQAQKLEALGRVSGGIAHDFGNILRVVHGYLHLLELEGQIPQPSATYVKEIKAAAERGSSLVQRLLAFSRNQPLKLQRVDLNPLIREMESLIRCTVGADRRFELELQEPLPQVQADPVQIHQVILNLVINAGDATPPEGLIRLSTREYGNASEEKGAEIDRRAYVELSVEDSGSGMDEETLKHIFEPFYTTKTAGRGTGLGLSTVYGIVQQSGGRILVSSEVGRGSLFRIQLPKRD